MPIQLHVSVAAFQLQQGNQSHNRGQMAHKAETIDYLVLMEKV